MQPQCPTPECRQRSGAHLFQVLAYPLQELGAVRILHHLLGFLHILAPLLLCSFQCRVPLPHGAGLAHQELLGIPDGDPFRGDVAPDTTQKRQACCWLSVLTVPSCKPHAAPSPKADYQCNAGKPKQKKFACKTKAKTFSSSSWHTDTHWSNWKSPSSWL